MHASPQACAAAWIHRSDCEPGDSKDHSMHVACMDGSASRSATRTKVDGQEPQHVAELPKTGKLALKIPQLHAQNPKRTSRTQEHRETGTQGHTDAGTHRHKDTEIETHSHWYGLALTAIDELGFGQRGSCAAWRVPPL